MENKTAPKNLTESFFNKDEYNFEFIVKNTSDMVSVLSFDLNPKYLYVSPSYEKILGYKPEDLIGKSTLELVHPEDVHKCSNLLKKYLKSNSDKTQSAFEEIPLRLKSKWGEWRDFVTTATLVKDKLIIISKDISKLKEVSESIKDKEGFENDMLNSMPNAALGLENRKIVFANKNVERVFGYKPEELFGQNTTILYRSAEEYEQIGRIVYPELEKNKIFTSDLEFPCIHKDGHEILCRITVSIIGEHFENKRIMAVYEDITELRKAMIALKEKEELQSSMLDAMPSFVVGLKNREITFVNNSIEQILGYKKEELIGKNTLLIYKDQAEYDRIGSKIYPVLKKKRVFDEDFTVTLTTKGGKKILTRLKAAIIGEKLEDNKVVATYDDITEILKKENELRRRLDFEGLVTNISSKFINTYNKNISSEIDLALKEVSKFSNADRSYIYLFSENKNEMIESYEWANKGIQSVKNEILKMSVLDLSYFFENLFSTRVFCIQDINSLPEKAVNEKKFLLTQKVKSIFVVPIQFKNNIIGFLGLDFIKNEIKFPDEILALLRMISDVFANIFEHKKSEELIKEQETKLMNIIQGVSFPIFVLDSNHKVTSWNKAMEDLTGKKAKDVLGTEKHWEAIYEIKHPTMADVILEQANKEILDEFYPQGWRKSPLIKNCYEAKRFFPQLGKNGKWLMCSVSPFFDKDGNIEGAIETIYDLTEMTIAQKNLEKIAADLEHSKNELVDKMGQLQKFNDLAVGRELRMIELKKFIKKREERMIKLEKKILGLEKDLKKYGKQE